MREPGTGPRLDDAFSITGMEITNATGILVEGGDALVEANRLDTTASGFIDVSGDGARILRNQGSVTENDPGIRLFCEPCTGGEVSDNRVSQVLDNDGIRVDASGPVKVAGNRLDRLGESGIVIEGASDGVVVSKNVVSRCGESGMETNGSTANAEISENKVNDCGFDCYEIQGDGHTLRRNQAKGCLENGFDVENPSDGVTLEDNKASKIQGVGLEVSLDVTNASLTGDRAKGSGRADLCDAGTATSITSVLAPVEETPPGGGDCPVD